MHINFIYLYLFFLCKETCKRHLQFTIPKVVALSPQMRLLEDDVSILSLSDIFKQVNLMILCNFRLCPSFFPPFSSLSVLF